MGSEGYFDPHVHLDDERVEREYPGGTEQLIYDSFACGICGMINIGTNPENSEKSAELAERFGGIYAAAGIHPSDAQMIGKDKIDAALLEIERLIRGKKVVAIGEIGLDYHYDGTDEALQKYVFGAQMSMARSCGLPVIIHDRDAHGDTCDMILKYPDVRTVLHSYSGSPEMARQLAGKGYYFSFGGPVTYKNAAKVKESAATVPDGQIMAETDTPYLPPVPHRGEMNRPGYIKHTVSALAEIRGVTDGEFCRLYVGNIKRFFGI